MSAGADRIDAASAVAVGEQPFRIGAEVRCNAGVCGHVVRVVVDPVARTLTHLVVRPRHGHGGDRLVPLELVDASSGEVALTCSMVDFGRLEAAEETFFLPGSSGYPGYGWGEAFSWPYYALGGLGAGSGLGGWALGGPTDEALTREVTPTGDVSIRRGEQVHATDGDIGEVDGLVMDPRDRRVTHVLLKEGHLWGRKQVALPIGNVSRVGASTLEVNIDKHDVAELPAVETDR